jgi:hypothetical protein
MDVAQDTLIFSFVKENFLVDGESCMLNVHGVRKNGN